MKDAKFYAALPGFKRENPPHYAAGPFYAENWEDPEGFHPYYYVKVSKEGFKLWQKRLKPTGLQLAANLLNIKSIMKH